MATGLATSKRLSWPLNTARKDRRREGASEERGGCVFDHGPVTLFTSGRVGFYLYFISTILIKKTC